MELYKQQPFTVEEHELFSCEILDLLYMSKDNFPHLCLKEACRREGVSYDWVHKRAKESEYWYDLVFMYEGLKGERGY